MKFTKLEQMATTLYYFDELTVEEISEVLCLSTEDVETTLDSARRKATRAKEQGLSARELVAF